MPPSVLDELRGKYSKFRTRHSEEFIAQKMEEERAEKERKQWEKLAMKTPTQEGAAREKRRRRRLLRKNLVRNEEGKLELRANIVDAIGREMERKLGMREVERRLEGVDSRALGEAKEKSIEARL